MMCNSIQVSTTIKRKHITGSTFFIISCSANLIKTWTGCPRVAQGGVPHIISLVAGDEWWKSTFSLVWVRNRLQMADEVPVREFYVMIHILKYRFIRLMVQNHHCYDLRMVYLAICRMRHNLRIKYISRCQLAHSRLNRRELRTRQGHVTWFLENCYFLTISPSFS